MHEENVHEHARHHSRQKYHQADLLVVSCPEVVREMLVKSVKGNLDVDFFIQVSVQQNFQALGAHWAKLYGGADQLYLLGIFFVLKVYYSLLGKGVFVDHGVFTLYSP